MNSAIEFHKNEYEELLEILDLNADDNHFDPDHSDDYFNAWFFGLSEEDCEFTITASL